MAVALGAVLVLGISALSSGGKTTTTSTAGGTTGEAQNAAVGKILRPSTTKGGTMRLGLAGDWDSLDTADTYYAYSWNFLLNYARTLTVFKAGVGAPTLVPDLAETPGVPRDNAKTWTYHLRDGPKSEDGPPITSPDGQHRVRRSPHHGVLPAAQT